MEELHTTPLAPLLVNRRAHAYPKGQIIIYQDDPITTFFVLEQGAVKLYDINANGHEKVLHILCTPTVFPLAYNFHHSAGALCFYGALTNVRVYQLPMAELEAHIEQGSELALYILEQAANEIRELLTRLDSMGKTTTYAKLVAALKFLATRHANLRPDHWRQVQFPVGHQLLADMTGMTRESVTTVMRQLLQRGIVRYSRQTILEIRLERLVGQIV